MNEEVTNTVLQAVIQVMASEVSGSLLVLSVALNAVLLAPIVARYLRENSNVDK
jgi:accessory gene regulator protein AgrB